MSPSTQTDPMALDADAVYRKVGLRLIPLLFVCYIAAYLDRVNVGFAKLQMQSALGLSDAVYGLGAGIFFIGYFLFEIPSNVILHKVGAGRWIARIMVTWGVLSAATMFVSSPAGFYLVRFLLGVAEAGFFPGIILYLTYWYPAGRRARATSLFMTAIAVAGIVGGPLSGWILHSLSGAGGLQGWQWLFLIEALPSVVLGVAAWFWLEDRVSGAAWLTPAERALIAREVAAEEAQKADEPILRVLGNPWVWLLAFVYFAIVSGLYGVTFWLPTIIKGLGVSDPLDVGLVSAVPWAFGIVAMMLAARSADRRMERRWHTLVACLVAAAGLEISVACSGQVVAAMAGLTLCAMGIMAALPVFWGNPTGFLGGTAAAAGIALINSVGNLSGFGAPFVIGWIKERTHSTDAGLHLLAGVLVIGAFAVMALRPAARAVPGAAADTDGATAKSSAASAR
jgi:D-galactonate transporter